MNHKKTLWTCLTILSLFVLNLANSYSQTVMVIKKTDNTVLQIPTSEIKEVTFTNTSTTSTENTVTDIDGNVYQTVTIGLQIWMAENLKTTKYNDGSTIPLVTDNTSWANLSSGGYCWYDNSSLSKNIYGGLYNWYAVNTDKLCPTGWHVPNEQDWNSLVSPLGSTPGAKLKETGTSKWKKTGDNVTNETNFTALPGGTRFSSGSFSSLGSQGTFWTATENNTNEAWYRGIYDYTSLVTRYSFNKKSGLSVRCIKD